MNPLSELVAGRPPVRLFSVKEVGESVQKLQKARGEKLISSRDFSRGLYYLLLYARPVDADEAMQPGKAEEGE